jgi:hypothetical protein
LLALVFCVGAIFGNAKCCGVAADVSVTSLARRLRSQRPMPSKNAQHIPGITLRQKVQLRFFLAELKIFIVLRSLLERPPNVP